MNDNITTFLRSIEQAIGVEFWLVGGCVRDELLGLPDNDIDVLALGLSQDDLNAGLAQFGKVDVTGAVFGVTRLRPNDRSIPMLEISLPRKEVSTGPSHKDFKVEFDHTLRIEDDLERRDITINSFAKSVATGEIKAVPFARFDLKNGSIRFISDTSAQDDPLRILRVIRFISKLDFHVVADTEKQMVENVHLLEHVSAERIQDELLKILKGDHVASALRFAQKVGIFKVILPELEACVGVTQNKYHALPVFDHIVEVVQHTETDDVMVRLAALFHDIAKPPTKWVGDDGEAHFYMPEDGQKFDVEPEVPGNHEIVGADMTRVIMNRLKFSSSNVDRVAGLVRLHMFVQGRNLKKQAARKLLRHLSNLPGDLQDNVDALFALRYGDIKGGKVDKVNQEYLDSNAAFKEIVDAEVAKESAISVKDLAIGGNDLKELGIEQGPVFGVILNGLLDKVIEDPSLNTKEALLGMVGSVE